MKKKLLYIYYYLKHTHHKLRAKFGGSYSIPRSKFLGQLPPSDDEANNLISDYIRSGEPFALCRFGSAEFTMLHLYEEYRLFGANRLNQCNIFDLFHQDVEQLTRWVELTQSDCHDVDIMAYFEDYPMEEYLIRSYRMNSKMIRLEQIEAIIYENPWTMALAGKKVLIVSPFVDAIAQQYPIIDKIYVDRDMLPSFELKTLKSVWFTGDPECDDFDSWFDALNYLYEGAMKIDFDIALLSCGPFGFNLACMLKRAGKQAIVYGGALQVLFGVWGARWDLFPIYKKHYNEHWIRPSQSDGPDQKHKDVLDHGCYW